MNDLSAKYAYELKRELFVTVLGYARSLRRELESQDAIVERPTHDMKRAYNVTVETSVKLYEAMYFTARELHRVSGIGTSVIMRKALRQSWEPK